MAIVWVLEVRDSMFREESVRAEGAGHSVPLSHV